MRKGHYNMDRRPTQLYRHFDACGHLLYVGVSLNVMARLSQHKRNAPWFDQITNITVEHFESRQDALRAEYEAIILENPKHNTKRPTLGGDLIYKRGGVLRILPPKNGSFDQVISAAARLFPDLIEASDHDL